MDHFNAAELAPPSGRRGDEPTKTAEACSLAALSWDRMMQAVDAVRDRLGRHVDHGIRDMVVVSNLLGLPTLQSCAGHVNEQGYQHAAPWVDFVVDDAVLSRAAALLDTFHAEGEPSDDVRLLIEKQRLSNGGGYVALERTRQHLAEGLLTRREVDLLRGRLADRQAEMQRFVHFLRRQLQPTSQQSGPTTGRLL